jgi:hypothetical protein
MVYGAPTLNLAGVEIGVEYDRRGSVDSSIFTEVEILIGPLIFVSPSHIRLFVQFMTRSGDMTTTIQGGSYSSTLVAYSKNQIAFTTTKANLNPPTRDYSAGHILEADFSNNITGDNRIDYIEMNCILRLEGAGLEPVIAKTYGIYQGNIVPRRLYIEWIESAVVVVGKNSTPGRYSNYAQHCCLPPSPVAGQTHRIKNGSYDLTGINVFIHAIGNQIDNKNSNLYPNGFIIDDDEVVYDFRENGFVLPPLHACMLVYDGTKWNIQEYFNAARTENIFDWWYDPPAVSPDPPHFIPLITKPVIICDTTQGGKRLGLPDPAGPLKLVRVIGIPAANPSSTAIFLFPYPGTKMEDNVNGKNSFYLRPSNASANSCMTLISDGVQWWVANVYEGTNSIFTTQGSSWRPLSLKPLTIVRTVDGVRLPPVTLSPGLANETFIKMDAASEYNGVVIGTNDTNVSIGTAANNCMFAQNPWMKYTAVSVIGLFNGTKTIYFVTSYFSGY